MLSEYAAKLGEDLPTGAYSKLANLLARPVGGRTMDRKDLDEKVEEMKDRGSRYAAAVSSSLHIIYVMSYQKPTTQQTQQFQSSQ